MVTTLLKRPFMPAEYTNSINKLKTQKFTRQIWDNLNITVKSLKIFLFWFNL